MTVVDDGAGALFPGFRAVRLPTTSGDLVARIGGSGPPLLLLHGYPQTHVMWHAVAPGFAERYTVVCPDLPGYGASAKPPSVAGHTPYSKRSMAAALVEMMAALGHAAFAVVGHDRGARVAYRMALDHPDRVTRLAVLDIVPTLAHWQAMDYRAALRSYHWLMLAQPAPLPETLIGRDPLFYLRNTLQRWAAPGFAFEPRALAAYERAFADPEVVRACCEDYRAGATIDIAIDAEDHGRRRIACPVLALWSELPGTKPRGVVETWREWAGEVRGFPVACGHFLAEEEPEATGRALREFFGS